MSVVRWVADSLFEVGARVVTYSNLPQSSAEIKEAQCDLAVVDSYLADLKNICFKLIWYFRLRVVVVTSDTGKDWSEFKLLGVDAFISPKNNHAQLIETLQGVSSKGTPIFPKLKILVIEDDNNIREAIRICIRMFWPEIEVSIAKDGKSGLDLLKTTRPDLVLLDLGLPDISGYEVMANIRACSQIPILVLTATAEKDYIVRAIQEGANDYVLKPFQQADLMCRIKTQVLRLLNQDTDAAFRFFL